MVNRRIDERMSSSRRAMSSRRFVPGYHAIRWSGAG